MPESAEERFEVHDLPRGGQVVVWGDFIAQVGVYPETIKDTMGTPHGVPGVYILPERLFDISMGVSRAEVEFPTYFNFYLNSRKTTIVCRRHQLKPVCRVLQEAVFGPRKFDLDQEYPAGHHQADLEKEMAYFKRDEKRPGWSLRLRDMVEFKVFDEEGKTTVKGVTISNVGAYHKGSCDIVPQLPVFQLARN